MGIEWPIDTKTQKVSTTTISKKVWGAALKPLAESDSEKNDTLREEALELMIKIQNTPNKEWRHGYIPHVFKLCTLMAKASPKKCLEMAQEGLDSLNSLMKYSKSENNGEGASISVTAKEAVFDSTPGENECRTMEIKGGSGESNIMTRFELGAPRRDPSDSNDIVLVGDDMIAQVDKWAEYGCIEPSCAESAQDIANMEDISELVKGKIFVLLGATSSLGPFSTLTKIKGCTIAAIARPGKKMESLISYVKRETDPSVTVLLPTLNDGKTVGADLISQTPELARWITSLATSASCEKQIVLCNLAYLDGEKHVRASVGMDLICEYVCEKKKNTALAYLVSPATAHLIPEEAQSQEVCESKKKFWHKFVPGLSSVLLSDLINFNSSEVKGDGYYVLNGLADLQGPNYALAKTSQQWRAMLMHSKGHQISANHGPPSRTDSMVSHNSVSSFLEGMQMFEPLVAFDVKPANSLMTCLLLWDLFYGDGNSGKNNKEEDPHPMCLLVHNSAHGGSWRCPYDLNSISASSYIAGLVVQSGLSPADSLA